jgi:hypothetical protein
MMSYTTALHLLVLFVSAVHAAQPPPELYSEVVTRKLLDTANQFPAMAVGKKALFPQFTDKDLGQWIWIDRDSWSSGFLPATLYEMNTRKLLCDTGEGNNSWVGLAQQWSTPLLSLVGGSRSIGHDVGFLSYPFVAELARRDTFSVDLTRDRDIFYPQEIRAIQPHCKLLMLSL